jgi:hypothetical protein
MKAVLFASVLMVASVQSYNIVEESVNFAVKFQRNSNNFVKSYQTFSANWYKYLIIGDFWRGWTLGI